MPVAHLPDHDFGLWQQGASIFQCRRCLLALELPPGRHIDRYLRYGGGCQGEYVPQPELTEEQTAAQARAIISAALAKAAATGSTIRTVAEMEATLAVCFGGCDQLKGNICRRWGSRCERREAWLSVIRMRGCDREKMPG